MERQILIANTKTQKKNKITTSATTLAELKDALSALDIDYSGMSFTEGISNTQLLDDNSILPNNTRTVKDKDGSEYSLVLLLTNTKKNIPLGVIPSERAELFSYIKAHNLQAAVVAEFGKNMTQVKTDALSHFVAIHNAEATSTPSASQAAPAAASTTVDDILAQHGFIDESEQKAFSEAVGSSAPSYVDIITALIQNLYDSDVLDADDIDDIIGNAGDIVD